MGSLNRENEEDRRKAAEVLGRIGPAAVEAVPALIGTLRDTDSVVCGIAAVALGSIGPPASAAVPALIELLRHGTGDASWNAAVALGRMGSVAAAAVPALSEVLRDQSPAVRWIAAEALGRIGPGAVEAVPALLAALRDEDAVVCERAAIALGAIGPAAAPAAPALLELLWGDDAGIRHIVAAALRRILSVDFGGILVGIKHMEYRPDAAADAWTALTGEGLERMGPGATECTTELQFFLHVTEVFRKENAQGRSLTFGELSKHMECSATSLREQLNSVSTLFHQYFKGLGLRLPPDHEQLTLQAAERSKLFGRGQGQNGFRIYPLGWLAEGLARRYLGPIAGATSKTT